MKIEKNKNLKEFNTFGISSIAKYFINVNNKNELFHLFKEDLFKKNKFLILGGGSNILLPDFFDGIVININTLGIDIKDDEDYININIQAGENWHNFVEYTVENHYYGLENLALIPGKVGAAPIQNIGAYGVEQNQFFLSAEYFNIETGEFKTINKKDCDFSYRNSIFKNELKDKVIITEVNYTLSKVAHYNITYKELNDAFANKEFNQRDIFDLVCEVRNKKLPNPKVLGNSGSFFKNPIISNEKFSKIKEQLPEISSYYYSNDKVKISAAYLIEKSGFKGYREGDSGVSPNHSLILVNYGNARAEDIYNLSEKIINKVNEEFEIELEREVNVI